MENIDSEVQVEKDPQCVDDLIELHQNIHEYRMTDDLELKEKTMKSILKVMTTNGMSMWYNDFCKSIGTRPKAEDIARMEIVRKSQLIDIESSKITEGKTIDSPTDEVLLKRISYLFYSGETKEACILVNDCLKNSISETFKVVICFLGLRFGLFMKDNSLVSEYLIKANQIFENYTNWEQRNRLSVYEGLYQIGCAKYNLAIESFLVAISTYRSPELMSYNVFLSFTVILALATLDRPLLKKTIVEQSEVTSMLQQSPATNSLLRAFDECLYEEIFDALDKVCEHLKRNVFFAESVKFISQEIEIRAFNQFLEAYQTVSLSSMAVAFGLNDVVLEGKLFQRISEGRVFCQIDKVTGHVIGHVNDDMSSSYQDILRRGSILQNQLQMLSKVFGV